VQTTPRTHITHHKGLFNPLSPNSNTSGAVICEGHKKDLYKLLREKNRFLGNLFELLNSTFGKGQQKMTDHVRVASRDEDKSLKGKGKNSIQPCKKKDRSKRSKSMNSPCTASPYRSEALEEGNNAIPLYGEENHGLNSFHYLLENNGKVFCKSSRREENAHHTWLRSRPRASQGRSGTAPRSPLSLREKTRECILILCCQVN